MLSDMLKDRIDFFILIYPDGNQHFVFFDFIRNVQLPKLRRT